MTDAARDIDAAQHALSAWYGTDDLTLSQEHLASGLEALVRAISIVARQVDRLEDAGILELRRAAEQVVGVAEHVIGHIGETDEQDGKLLLDLATAVDQLRRRLSS